MSKKNHKKKLKTIKQKEEKRGSHLATQYFTTLTRKIVSGRKRIILSPLLSLV
jgi:hypothetical protein